MPQRYDQLRNLILKAEGSVVSSRTLDIMFSIFTLCDSNNIFILTVADMIVDSKFDKESIGTCIVSENSCSFVIIRA